MSDLRKVGALWKKEGGKGEYFSGTLDAEAVKSALAGDETRLLIFPTRNRHGKMPDFEIFSAPNEGWSRSAQAESPRRRDTQLDDF